MRLPLLFLAALVLGGAPPAPASEPVSAEGRRLAAAFDAMEVEKHWIAGAIVDWKRGEPTGQPVTDGASHTHCSQFAASACDRLGVYLLHPPEHSSKGLANAQFDWLGSERGKKAGWAPVPDGATAQDLANRGRMVVAVCKNPDPAKPGHIALVRPCDKDPAALKAEGPQITQAGASNFNSAGLKEGFRHHPGAFKNGEIRFFTHAVGKLPVQ